MCSSSMSPSDCNSFFELKCWILQVSVNLERECYISRKEVPSDNFWDTPLKFQILKKYYEDLIAQLLSERTKAIYVTA